MNHGGWMGEGMWIWPICVIVVVLLIVAITRRSNR